MSRILVRAGKSPLEVISYEDTLDRNVLGSNCGNLVFSEAVWRHLSVGGAGIEAAGLTTDPTLAPRINAEFDRVVLPFANAFRRSFRRALDRYTELIRRLRIPVTVVGIGAQTSADYSMEWMKPLRRPTTAFMKAVLARSESIGVRGEFTYEFLRSLGFSDHEVTIVGCPSVFYYGEHLPPLKETRRIDRETVISMNVSPYVPGIKALFMENYRAYPGLFYVPQNNESLDQLLWAGANLGPKARVFPKSIDHPVFRRDRIRFCIDPRTWIKALRDCEFVFGTRIHGNIVALLAGTPSFVLAHDSRTLELARYHEIPHLRYSEMGERRLAADLLEVADYGPLRRNHAGRFGVYRSFLERQGVEHVFQDGRDGGAAFDEKMSRRVFPEPLRPIKYQTDEQRVARERWYLAKEGEHGAAGDE